MNQSPRATTSMHNQIDDDEIDLVDLFRLLWSKKNAIIMVTTIFVILAGIYSIFSPKEYKAEASFFITSSNKPSGSLMGYASILGINTPSDIESLIKNILDSYSIKATIATTFKEYFKEDIQKNILRKTLKNEPAYIESFVIGQLNLHKNFSFSVTKSNLFELTYSSTDKTLTKKVLDAYITQIVQYNKSLELSAERNIITIVDAPRIPLNEFKPNIKFNLILGFMLGGFLSSLAIIIRHAIKPPT